MGRSPCCSTDDDATMKKGPWTPEEDQKLIHYINNHRHGNWKALSKQAGLNRCGKSCRLRWANYLRPDIKRGRFSEEEERIIINLHSTLGNKWSKIATYLPGRTDNEIKNFWNTHMRKKLHKLRTDDLNHLLNLSQLICAAQLSNLISPLNTTTAFNVQADAADQVAQVQLLQNLIQTLNTSGLMGSQNSYPFEGLINEPTPIPEKFQSEGSISQTSSDQSPDASDFLTDNSISTLVSESPETTTSMPISVAWEKLMDDETGSSCWKDILDLTSSSSSPIEW